MNFEVVSYQISNPYATGNWGGNNFLIRYNPYSMYKKNDKCVYSRYRYNSLYIKYVIISIGLAGKQYLFLA